VCAACASLDLGSLVRRQRNSGVPCVVLHRMRPHLLHTLTSRRRYALACVVEDVVVVEPLRAILLGQSIYGITNLRCVGVRGAGACRQPAARRQPAADGSRCSAAGSGRGRPAAPAGNWNRADPGNAPRPLQTYRLEHLGRGDTSCGRRRLGDPVRVPLRSVSDVRSDGAYLPQSNICSRE